MLTLKVEKVINKHAFINMNILNNCLIKQLSKIYYLIKIKILYL